MTGDWDGHDPTCEVDESADTEQMAKREEALAEVARHIADGDYAGARKELDALDQPDDARQLGAEELLSEAEAAPNPVNYLRRQLNKRDPAGTLQVQKEWTDEYRPRDWLCPKWLPAGRVVMLTGTGGGGKSLLALQLAVAVASCTGKQPTDGKGRNVLADPRGIGKAPKVLGDGDSRPVVFATWEDEHDEFLRRLHWLPDCDRSQLGTRLHVVNLAGSGALWGPRAGGHRDIVAELTPIGAAFEAYVRAKKPRLVVIDPVAGAYGANENDRSAVRAYLSHLNQLAADTGAAILLVAHPGKNRESQDYSGSTDWRAGIRGLWTLKPEPLLPYVGAPAKEGKPTATAQGYALTLAKANYAKDGRRAWLRLRIEYYGPDDLNRPPLAKVGDVKVMVWEECSALEAADAYHKHRDWQPPSERKRERAANPTGSPKLKKSEEPAPGQEPEPGYDPPYTDKHGLAE